MYKLIMAALVTLCCLPAVASAQSFWRYFERPDFGGGLIFYDYEAKERITSDPNSDESVKRTFTHYAALGGFNFPIVALGDNMSVGINPGLGFSATPSGDFYGGSSTSFLAIEVPWYATLKLGADATYKGSTFPIGGTIGIGYHYSYIVNESSILTHGIGTPSLMAEVSFGKRKSWGLLKLRYTHDLGSHTSDFSNPSINLESKLSISRSSFQLLFVSAY